jgi:brefeldin A-resistance guanine nucleotide exchange factor 1
MLNTDLHNPQIRVSSVIIVFTGKILTRSQKRMTIEEYRRNLRGVNNGANFSPEYLVRYYLGNHYIFPNGNVAKHI